MNNDAVPLLFPEHTVGVRELYVKPNPEVAEAVMTTGPIFTGVVSI
jgi:hypothetical protein